MTDQTPITREDFDDLKQFFVTELRNVSVELRTELRAEIHDEVGGLRAEMTRRFDETDTKIAVFQAHVDRRFENVDRRFDDVYDRFDQNDSKLDGILTAIDERFTPLEAR